MTNPIGGKFGMELPALVRFLLTPETGVLTTLSQSLSCMTAKVHGSKVLKVLGF